MSTSGRAQGHWFRVARHFAVDLFIFCFAFIVGLRFRFGEDFGPDWVNFIPGIIVGAIAFPSVVYLLGLYSPLSSSYSTLKRLSLLTLCLVIATLLMLVMFYVNFSTRIGRGVMLISWCIAHASIIVHHVFLNRWATRYRERVAFAVASESDELEAQFLQSSGKSYLDFVGVIHTNNHELKNAQRNLGSVEDVLSIVRRYGIEQIVCSNKSITDDRMRKIYSQLRYAGITVVPLINFCEEVYQRVPLNLVTPEWLLIASGMPHIFYIRKLKRAFDIVVALLGLLFLSPFLLAGMLAVRFSSRGPILFSQARCGRFGRPFRLYKLRTMATDAEQDGPTWATENDSRLTPVGGFLRKFRIDEIPQLFNVLRGSMSFVGPRPERPEFIEQLSNEILFFPERTLVQPGITGWAQVNYPYGGSVEDAKRKLEFDLYYMKHMSLFLDTFILLDTVRIILRGGLRRGKGKFLELSVN